MNKQPAIEYIISASGAHWGIFRDGVPVGVRADIADAIAYANFFADRETLLGREVRVRGDDDTHLALHALRRAA